MASYVGSRIIGIINPKSDRLACLEGPKLLTDCMLRRAQTLTDWDA